MPQLYVDVDREKAKKRSACRSTISSPRSSATLGNYYVNDFNKYGRAWQVLMSAEPPYRTAPRRHRRRLCALDEGRDDPARARWRPCAIRPGPDALDRFNNLPAVKIFGGAAPGYSSGQAIARVEQIANEVLPADFSYDWGGTSYQEKNARAARRPSRSASR